MSKSEFKIHSIHYNFLMNIILKMSSFIFPLITFPYVSRVLGASGNGKLAFASAVINYFSLFASLGIPSYGVKVCAQVRDDKDKLSKTVQELLTINLFCMFVSYITFIILMMFIPEFRENQLLLWINSISIFLSSIGVEWFYQAIEQYDYITFRNILFKIVSIVLMFIFVKKSDDYIVYGGITVIGTYGSNILNVIRLPKYISLKKKYKYSIKKHLSPIFSLFLYSAATTIYTNLDTVMLGLMVGDNQVGYYNAAVKVKGILASVVTAMSAVLLPRVSYYLSMNDNKSFLDIIKKTFNFVFAISIPLTLFFDLAAEPTILILAGSDYFSSIIPMQIITPAIIFIGIGSITAWQMLIPLGREKITVIGALFGAIVDLIINLILIPKFGASGAAIGTLIAEICVVLVHFVALKDQFHSINIFDELYKIVLACVFSSFIFIFINRFNFCGSNLLKMIVLSVSFFSSYFLILVIEKESIANELLKKYFSFFKKI